MGSCYSGWADCTASPGCETLLNSNPSKNSATDLGQVDGDCEYDYRYQYGNGEKWFKIKVNDATWCKGKVELQVSITNPVGANYKLYLYDGNTYKGSGTTVTAYRKDSWTSDNSWTAYIFVEWVSGSACGNWKLTIRGGDQSN